MELNAPAPTLLFIPDISGFTKFVNNTDIMHSQHIIQELLEEIIDANEIGLEVSEIEGDAVLFYKTGISPTAAELLAQVQRMYTRFHSLLGIYKTQRICHCGACLSAENLSLKFVMHYGDISMKKVKEFHKLFGKDLIVAHRLMKNKVPHDEYVLFTHELMNACANWVKMKATAWSDPHDGAETYDFGEVNYCYLTLEELKKHIPPTTVQDHLAKNAMQKYDTFERIINAPLDLVFSVLSDLDFRSEWIPYVKGISELNSKITRTGSAHRCVVHDNSSDPYFVNHSYNFEKDVITYIETEPNYKVNVFYTLRRVGKGITRIQRVQRSKNGIINKIKYMLKGRKGNVAWINGALDNFKSYCEDLTEKGEMHSSQIVLQK